MPKIEFDVTSGVAPERFIGALTDFSPKRAEIWPNIDEQHLKVHEVGDDWADVTEGSSLAGGVWERNRYDWSTPGTVRVETTESNTWRPGARGCTRSSRRAAAVRSTSPSTGARRPCGAGWLRCCWCWPGGPRLRRATEQVLRKLEQPS
jgi:hypothetical protein